MASALDVAVPYVANAAVRPAIGTFELGRASSPTCTPPSMPAAAILHGRIGLPIAPDSTRKDARRLHLFCAESATRAALDAIQLLAATATSMIIRAAACCAMPAL